MSYLGRTLGPCAEVKELVLTTEWTRPLHVVVVVDEPRQEERIVTVYEPDDDLWTDGHRGRRLLTEMLAGDIEVATRHFSPNTEAA